MSDKCPACGRPDFFAQAKWMTVQKDFDTWVKLAESMREVYDAAMALQAEIARSVVHPVEGGLSDLMTDYALLKNPRLAEAVGAFDCACRRAEEGR